MPLSLYLLRHAKAQQASLSQDDFDRALAPRGMEDAEKLGIYLKDQHVQFDYAWCSSAMRTTQTLEQLALSSSVEINHTRDLYHASYDNMLSILQLTPTDAKTVLMVGHNPGISQLAATLAQGGGDESLVAEVHMQYPTCALSVFEFGCESWQEVDASLSAIKSFIIPKGDWPETISAR